MNSIVNYYDILSVNRTASIEEIKKSFRKLAKENHPDLFQGESAEVIAAKTKKFQEINSAYEILSDEKKRAEFDKKLAEYEAIKKQQRQSNYEKSSEQHKRTENTRKNGAGTEKTASDYTRQNAQQTYSDQTRRNAQQTYSDQTRRNAQQTYSDQTSRNTQRAYSDQTRRNTQQTYSDQTKKNTQQSSSEQTRKKSRQTASTNSGYRKATSDIKQAWQEIKAEEKKAPFRLRHKKINGRVYKSFYKEEGNTWDEVVFLIKSGVIHTSAELFFQLEKLTHITEDTIPKYFIRNRVTAFALALVMAMSAIAIGNDKTKENVPVSDYYVTNQPNNSQDFYADDQDYINESEKENRDYRIVRTYEVQSEDTLTELAIDANTSIEAIMELNGLKTDLIKIGDTLYIPYFIEGDNLKYATVAAYYQPGMDLTEFAKEYNTDRASIYTLNTEAFEDGKVISDTLLVPTFSSQKEIKNKKETKSYTYTNIN